MGLTYNEIISDILPQEARFSKLSNKLRITQIGVSLPNL